MTSPREVHVVYDDNGKVLAIAETVETEGPGGLRLRLAPLPQPGQRAVRVSLADDQAALTLSQLLDDFELEHDKPLPSLRRRKELL